MTKITFLLSLSFILFLISCGREEIPPPTTITNTGVTHIMTPEEKVEKIETRQGNVRSALLKNMEGENKDIFLSLDKAKESNDMEKVTEILSEIEKLKSKKKDELEIAVKAGNTKKVDALKKEIRVIHIMLNH